MRPADDDQRTRRALLDGLANSMLTSWFHTYEDNRKTPGRLRQRRAARFCISPTGVGVMRVELESLVQRAVVVDFRVRRQASERVEAAPHFQGFLVRPSDTGWTRILFDRTRRVRTAAASEVIQLLVLIVRPLLQLPTNL